MGNTPTKGTPGDGDTPTDTPTPKPPVNLNQYPYSINQTDIGSAKKVMEEAGYSESNQFELDWLHPKSPLYKNLAKTMRSRLDAAHVKMNISSTTWTGLLKATKQGKPGIFPLGWIADYPGPKNFVQLIAPNNTTYGTNPKSANGARLFWSKKLNNPKADPEVRQFMQNQFNRISNNPEPTQEARKVREDAAVKMEEGMWKEAILMPTTHGLSEYMWYDTIDYNVPGGMGGSRAKASVSVESLQSDTLSGTSSTIRTLDPIASGDTTSGSKVMDMNDALVNYYNGTTEVRNLLAKSYKVSDDFTTYTFKLKEGVQFHGNKYGEVTAEDVVYSIKRLVVSPNSTNSRFPVSVMGLKMKNEDNKKTGDIPADSIGVRKTGKYEVEIEIEKPFSYTLSVLAYSAFSVIPAGIVGDAPGTKWEGQGDMKYQEYVQSPIGCGPLKFVKWESGEGGEFVMERFDDYHGKKAVFERAHDLITSSTSTAYNYFLNKNAQIGGVPTAQYDPSKVNIQKTKGVRRLGTYGPLKNGETVNYARVPTLSTFYIAFNVSKVPRPVRQAAHYVFNTKQFVRKSLKNRSKPGFHLQPPQIFPGGLKAYNKHYKP